MKRITTMGLIAAAALTLAACSEKPQDNQGGAALDAPAHQGTGVAVYTASGWQSGDRNSWQQALKVRAQSQNEYQRVQAK